MFLIQNKCSSYRTSVPHTERQTWFTYYLMIFMLTLAVSLDSVLAILKRDHM